jgi:hypothetical protein
MAMRLVFDKAKAQRIVKIVAAVGDGRTLISNMRTALIAEFKGYPRKALDDVEIAMLRDQFKAEFTQRPTVADSSVGPMTSEHVKVCTYMPLILGMNEAAFEPIGKNWRTLSTFATLVRKHKGNIDLALKDSKGGGRKNYKKSAAVHGKALVNMNDGKFLTPAQKALVIALMDSLGIDLGEQSTDYRDAKAAAALAAKSKA